MQKIISAKGVSASVSDFGAKACGLIFLQSHNFNTPEFYLLPFPVLKNIGDDSSTLVQLLANWQNEFSIEQETLWAVRSSANIEDGLTNSYAGQFLTVLNVSVDDLGSAIGKVLEGYKGVVQNGDSKEQLTYGIIIQKMLDPDFAGVIFSHNPNDIRDPTMTINLVPGLAENLVQGKEIAFGITVQSGKFNYSNLDDSFATSSFEQDLQNPQSKSGRKILVETKELLPKLVSGVNQMLQLKKVPVDIEFCTKGTEIFWLQVRPITTGKTNAKEPTIWDNTSTESNFPGHSLPLTISLMRYSLKDAYSNMAQQLGMKNSIFNENKKWLDNMCGEINGALYYNVTAWQKLTYQAPFGKKLSQLLTAMWGMETAAFTPPAKRNPPMRRMLILLKFFGAFILLARHKRRYYWHFNDVMTRFDKVDFSSYNHNKLVSTFHDINIQLRKNWLAPVLNGFYTMVFFSTLKNRIVHSKIIETHPNFVNDVLFSTNDIISVAIVREYQKLIELINQQPALAKLFCNNEPEEIQLRLKADFGKFHEKIETYVAQYGDRCEAGELSMETINYKEEPLKFILFLKQNIALTRPNENQQNSFVYKKVLRNAYPLNIFKRLFFDFLIRNTIDKVRQRENYRFMRTRTFSLLRRIFRAIDNDLFSKGCIDQPSDSLYLELDEILDTSKTSTYKALILQRKAKYESYKGVVSANRFIKRNGRVTPLERTHDFETGDVIDGTGCCSGVVVGEALVLVDYKGGKLETNQKILIAPYFEPGWINLFSQAAGIISERGNLLSHTAIICREMGVPSIVGAKGVTRKIKSGDLIQMNGATGKIKLHVKD